MKSLLLVIFYISCINACYERCWKDDINITDDICPYETFIWWGRNTCDIGDSRYEYVNFNRNCLNSGGFFSEWGCDGNQYES